MSSSPTQKCFFVALGNNSYQPTEHSGGAWREDELHLAPVAGLIIHVLERWRSAQPEKNLEFSRIAFEVLGQIARDTIDVSIDVVRPGRTIELVEATAVIADRVTIRARAWLLQQSPTLDVEANEFEPMPNRSEMSERSSLLDWPGGFCASIEGVQSASTRPGRSQTWLTSDITLVCGEDVSALANFCRLLDAANGVAVRQPFTSWMFPNVDLTLHFFRQPSGDWVGLDTRVAFGPGGAGLTSTVMHDDLGPVGTANQSLTLRRL